jgi:hypothetical protein
MGEIIKRKPHTELKGIYSGKDIYVLGSGSSMSFIDKSFFIGKIIIGTNFIWKFFPVTYNLFKHSHLIQEAIDAGQITIISKHDCGDIDKPLNEYEANYVFTHKRGRFEDREEYFQENLDAIGRDDDIFVSYSTITSCIHLAAYMGAKNILICGHDCGYIDGASNLDNYADRAKGYHQTEENFNKCYNDWFELINEDSIKLKRRLIEVYDCNIYSINPFINLRLEGHRYDTKKL